MTFIDDRGQSRASFRLMTQAIREQKRRLQRKEVRADVVDVEEGHEMAFDIYF